jgi:hypothetical protein
MLDPLTFKQAAAVEFAKVMLQRRMPDCSVEYLDYIACDAVALAEKIQAKLSKTHVFKGDKTTK